MALRGKATEGQPVLIRVRGPRRPRRPTDPRAHSWPPWVSTHDRVFSLSSPLCHGIRYAGARLRRRPTQFPQRSPPMSPLRRASAPLAFAVLTVSLAAWAAPVQGQPAALQKQKEGEPKAETVWTPELMMKLKKVGGVQV